MAEEQRTLEMLTSDVIGYLQKLSYSSARISQYRSAWQKVRSFMKENDILFYSPSVGESFIYKLIGERRYADLERWEKSIIQCTNVLTEFLETDTVKYRRCQKFRELQGAVGRTMQNFISDKRSCGISRETVEEYKHHLQKFLNYLDKEKIQDINLLNQQLIIGYVNNLVFCSSYVRRRSFSIIKGYFRYLYDHELTAEDYSRTVPKEKCVKQALLPSTYTKEEIDSLLKSIDRGSPKGKRDYAMVLITARLGLRASDVCCLSFENICWDKSLLILKQQKTGENIELPLLMEIGEAIIDYLKYGRPESKLPYIFLHVQYPYDRLNRSTLHRIVCFYLRRAGIRFEKGRKHGPHALRHSLAAVLLEKKTPIPIISKVLGHKNTESTRSYLRIDLNSLRHCALEVPSVQPSFYSFAKGGLSDE